MSQAIEARQVNSDGPHLSSSKISRKDETQPPIEQQHLLRLIQGLNRFNSSDRQSYTNENVVPAPETRLFEHQSSERPFNINEPSRYMKRNYTQVSPIGLNAKIVTDVSPIRKFQNEDLHQVQAKKLQQKVSTWHNNFQSPQQSRPTRNEYNLSSHSVSDYFSRNALSYFGRPHTYQIEGGQTDRSTYFSGDEYNKYRVESENQTKPHTYREGDNVTGLSSLNSSYKKITNFSSPNNEPIIRPYSTLNFANRPQSFNPTDWNRPISYQDQNLRLMNLHQNHSDNRGGMTNLTALESQGVIEEDAKYMRTFVERPVAGYENEGRLNDGYRPMTGLYEGVYRNNQEVNRQLGNLQETNIDRVNLEEQHEVVFSNITEIKRPHYQNKYVQKRQLRKLGGQEEPKVTFKNNWILLALLLLLLLGLISLGVWFGRNSYLQKHKYQSGYAEITDKQPGVKPTLVDPTQIKYVNTTESTNQTTTNISTPTKPIEYPPISINITIVNPQIQTRNDTIIKQQPAKPVVNVSILSQEVPIVFPPVEVGVQNGANGSVVSNLTEKPIEKPTVVEPVVVPQGNVTVNVSSNVTIVEPTNITQTPVKPVVPVVVKPETNLSSTTNLTVPNTSIPIEPVIIPVQPTKPIQTPIEPVIISPTPITPILKPINITQPIVNESKPKPTIDYRPTAEYIEAQKVRDQNEYQGYEASGYYYLPIEQRVDYSIEPAKSNQVYAQVVPYESTVIEPSKPYLIPPVSVPGAGQNYLLPSTSIQFDQAYEAPITDTTSDMSIEPTTTQQNFPKVDTNITTIIEPTIQPTPTPTITQTTITPITTPQPTIQLSIEPTLIQPTVIPFTLTQPKPTPQELLSYENQYLQPQKVSDFQVSVPPIKEQMDFQKIVNASILSGSISVEPVIGEANMYVTKPEKIQDIYVPSTMEISPTAIQTGNAISPIVTPIDLGTVNATIKPQETTTITPSQAIIEAQVIPAIIQQTQNIMKIPQKPVIPQTPISTDKPQAPYIESQNITNFEISILPNVQPITVNLQNQSFISPTRFPTIQPTMMTQPQTFVTPQPEDPAQVTPTVTQPVIATPNGDSSISALKDQTMTILPEIVDTYSVEPQKTIDEGMIKPNKTQDIEIATIPDLTPNDTISSEITPIELIPSITQPQIILPTTTPQQTMPPQTIPVQIQPQRIVPPIQIAPIPVATNQSYPSLISPQPTEIAPIQTSTIQPIQPTWIEPSKPKIPSFVEPSITQLPIESTSVINQTQQFQPIAQPPSLEPKTIIISQTNFTDPNEFIMNRVKRLTSILQPEAIYEIPQGYDKAKLAQIQKNFLAFYNKTLQQKSPLEIIPLFWKAAKDSTLLTENEYLIYYTQNETQNSGSVNYLPQRLPINSKSSAEPQVKETILEISPTGELIVLQKGSDWPQIEKNMGTSQNEGIPLIVFPNILKHQKVKHRHSLRRNQ